MLVPLKLTFIAEMVLVVPATKRKFDDYGLALGGLTRAVLQIGDLYSRFCFVLAPLLLLLMVGGVIAGRHLFRTPRPGNVFAAVCLFLLVGSIVVTAGGLLTTTVALAEGLSK